MKKRIISIILTLIMAFGVISVFSACDDDKGKEPKLATAVTEQYLDKIADIYDTQVGFEDEQTKQTFLTVLEGLVGQNAGLINNIGKKVVYPSGMTDKKIVEFLSAYNEYLKSEAQMEEYVASLVERYETDVNAILKEGADTSILDSVQDFSGLIQVLSEIVDKDGFMSLLNKIASNEKTGAVAVIGDLNAKAKRLSDSVYVEDVCSLMINFAYEFENLGIAEFVGISEETWNEFIAEIKVLQESLNSMGLNDASKKSAYLKLVSFVFGEVKEQQSLIYNVDASKSFDMVINVAKLSVASEGTEQINAFIAVTNSLTDILKDLGELLSARAENKIAMGSDLIKACKTLDKNGLGYYAERFANLYLRSYDFAGALLSSVNGKDLVWLYASTSNGTFSKELTEFTAEEILTGEEGFYKLAEMVSHSFETALSGMGDKDEFISSVNKAIGDGGTSMNLLLKSTADLNKYYDIDYSKDANFSKLSKDDQNKIESAYTDLILSLSSFKVVSSGMQVASESLKTFIQPMIGIYEYFTGLIK